MSVVLCGFSRGNTEILQKAAHGSLDCSHLPINSHWLPIFLFSNLYSSFEILELHNHRAMCQPRGSVELKQPFHDTMKGKRACGIQEADAQRHFC